MRAKKTPFDALDESTGGAGHSPRCRKPTAGCEPGYEVYRQLRLSARSESRTGVAQQSATTSPLRSWFLPGGFRAQRFPCGKLRRSG